VSVVTPSLDQAAYLEAAIESVREQDYPRIEHIVVDGGSTDRTIEILRRHDHLRWISEPDRGQADALNKGFALARGEVFAWLNADDSYLPGAVSAAVAALRETGADLVYGGWRQIDEHGDVLGEKLPVPTTYARLLEVHNVIPQPAAFFTRAAFERAGGLDERLHYALDYDLWLKIARDGRLAKVDRVLAAFRYHADSKTVASGDRFLPEVVAVSRSHGGRRWSTMYVDFYLPRHRPWLYRLVLAWRLLRVGDVRALAARLRTSSQRR
jgi:glycosyltransferase involved in cell wall biosynthesis